MHTKSRDAKPRFAPGSSRGPRRLDTLRAQMEDIERGDRIKELREARRLTQPAVVERMCAVGGPRRDGRPFIGLRGYQRYEEGGGISWSKAQVLAEVLNTTEDYILRGEGERREPRPARAIDTDLAERLASIEERIQLPGSVSRLDGELEARITRIEGTLQEILLLLGAARNEQDRISGLLDQQTSVLGRIEAATSDAGDAAERLDAAVRAADKALRSAPPEPPADTSKTARKSSPRAAR